MAEEIAPAFVACFTLSAALVVVVDAESRPLLVLPACSAYAASSSLGSELGIEPCFIDPEFDKTDSPDIFSLPLGSIGVYALAIFSPVLSGVEFSIVAMLRIPALLASVGMSVPVKTIFTELR